MVDVNSAIEPTKLNFAQKNNFTPFVIDRLPDIFYVMTEVKMPDISLGSANVFNSQKDYEIPGTVDFSDLSMTFIIDENFSNYIHIVNWMLELGFNEPRNRKIEDEVSDGSFAILDNNNNVVHSIRFRDCYPSRLGGPQFSSTEGQNQIVSTLDMKFTSFSIE